MSSSLRNRTKFNRNYVGLFRNLISKSILESNLPTTIFNGNRVSNVTKSELIATIISEFRNGNWKYHCNRNLILKHKSEFIVDRNYMWKLEYRNYLFRKRTWFRELKSEIKTAIETKQHHNQNTEIRISESEGLNRDFNASEFWN